MTRRRQRFTPKHTVLCSIAASTVCVIHRFLASKNPGSSKRL